ncbi:MAG TPA: DUF308 domain-containing protein [Polyangiaceae bacterium]
MFRRITTLYVLRGLLALGFAFVLLLSWHQMQLGSLVLVFGVYASTEGVLALSSGKLSSPPPGASFHVFEGVVSVVFGLDALLGFHFQRLEVLAMTALWAVATGLIRMAPLVSAIVNGREAWDDLAHAGAGAASLAFGVCVLLWPGSASLFFAVLLAPYAAIAGLAMLHAARTYKHVIDPALGAHPKSG